MRCATTNLVVYSTRCSSRERILATISCTNNMLTKPRSTSTANPSTALATSLGFVLSSKHLRWNTLMVWSSEDDEQARGTISRRVAGGLLIVGFPQFSESSNRLLHSAIPRLQLPFDEGKVIRQIRRLGTLKSSIAAKRTFVFPFIHNDVVLNRVGGGSCHRSFERSILIDRAKGSFRIWYLLNALWKRLHERSNGRRQPVPCKQEGTLGRRRQFFLRKTIIYGRVRR